LDLWEKACRSLLVTGLGDGFGHLTSKSPGIPVDKDDLRLEIVQYELLGGAMVSILGSSIV